MPRTTINSDKAKGPTFWIVCYYSIPSDFSQVALPRLGVILTLAEEKRARGGIEVLGLGGCPGDWTPVHSLPARLAGAVIEPI